MEARSPASTRAVVFDVGSHAIRVGYNHQTEAPKLCIPSVVGYPKQRIHVGMEGQEAYVGLDLMKHRSVCDVHYPLGDGKIERPDDLQALIRQGFQLLGANPEETSVVVTEPANASRTFRNDLGGLFLRTFRVPSIMMVAQGATSVFGCGITSGLVLDVGEHSARCFAMLDGVGLLSTYGQTPIAGQCVTQHLQCDLVDARQNAALSHSSQLKEALCFVRDIESDGPMETAALTQDYRLPDGHMVTLNHCRYQAPEVLFSAQAHRDAVAGQKAQRLPELCRDSLVACDGFAREVVAPSVVVCGGSAMLKNFGARLETSMKRCFELPPATRALVELHNSPVAPSERTWVGAAVLSSLASASSLFVTQADLSEEGLGALGRHRLLV
jgi:actin-related protein